MADTEYEVQPDLAKERGKATFDSTLMTVYLDGSKEKTERRKQIEKLVLDDPVYQHGPTAFMTRTEILDLKIKEGCHMIEMIRDHDLYDPFDKNVYKRTISPHDGLPFSLHDLMFIPSLLGQATADQLDKWLEKALTYQIIGTYAQTELGHGTFLRGLETTATYDLKREEFVIHSPTLTSIKWWPGNLGKTTNCAIVLAQLYTQGQCRGLHAFIVQIRDLETHVPLPGITVGDIGPKMGYESMDNGYLKFDNVRIPRDHMLMKHSQVLPDGTYIAQSTNSKLTYGTMLLVRAILTAFISQTLAESSTIAIRYSAVRKQSELKPGSEAFVLDYQTQQYKLFPIIAMAYAYHMVGYKMIDMYFNIQDQIDQGDLELLPELHALSAGMKAFTTWTGSAAIETCRMACGGHGYSHASGLPKIYMDAVPACTYEGENTVMMLQTARHLKKYYLRAQTGERIPGFMAYMSDPVTLQSAITESMEFSDIVAAYQHRARRLVDDAMRHIQTLEASGKCQYDSWNESSVLLVKCAAAHCHYYIVQNFVSVIEQPPVNRKPDSQLLPILQALCRLYGLHGIFENSGDFLQDGFLSGHQLNLVQDKLLKLLGEIRPNAVALVDAFDIPDRILDSTIGSYDGRAYERLYDWAQKSTLNKTQVPDGFHKYMKPMMEKMKSKL